MFCIYIRTNSDLCHLQHKLIGFYNRDEKCLQRGTDWVFKYNSNSFRYFKSYFLHVSCIGMYLWTCYEIFDKNLEYWTYQRIYSWLFCVEKWAAIIANCNFPYYLSGNCCYSQLWKPTLLPSKVWWEHYVTFINKFQRDATLCRCLFTAKLLYMFRVSIAPIIRNTSNCNCSFWYRS